MLLVAGGCILFGIGGCDWGEETGFVELRKGTGFSLSGEDRLVLNATEIPGLGQKDHLIIQEPTGATSLQLKRGDKSVKICDLEIKKNRVVTVTLTSVNMMMRCAVQT